MTQRAYAFNPWLAGLAGLAVLAAACAAPAIAPTALQPISISSPVSIGDNPARGIQFMVWGSSPQLQAYQDLIDLFRQSHPDQTVELIGMATEADYHRRLAADVAAGRPADVILASYTNVPGLVARGIVTAVAPLVATSQAITLGAFASRAISPFIVERQLQCVPLSASGLVIYYNKTLFQKANVPEPSSRWTRQAFLQAARALTQDGNRDGRPEQYGVGMEPTLINLTPFIWQYKGQLVDNPAWPTELTLSSPAVLSATEWLVSWQSQYQVAPDAQAELAEASEQRFAAGSLAMWVSSRASVPALRQLTAVDWDVASLPADNTGVSNVVLADGLCLEAASPNKATAWQFIEFAASAQGQAALARTGGIVPTLTAVAASDNFLGGAARPAHAQVYVEALAHAVAMPKLENWADIQAIADEELQQAFYGQKSVAQALADATTRSEEYFKIHLTH